MKRNYALLFTNFPNRIIQLEGREIVKKTKECHIASLRFIELSVKFNWCRVVLSLI